MNEQDKSSHNKTYASHMDDWLNDTLDLKHQNHFTYILSHLNAISKCIEPKCQS